MGWYERVRVYCRKEWLLISLLALAFSLRVVGVGYGLPLTVVNDETHFTIAALQMIQSHTLIPAFHPELFKSILPYPVYLSYILLLPFGLILGFKFLFWHGSTALLQAHIITDLSAFFIAARLLSVFLGVLSVYLVYRIGERLFHTRIAASIAGFLVATSLLHEALSMVGRNWMPTSIIFLLALFFLTHPSWSQNRRYGAAFLVAGVGMGISSFSAFVLAIIGLYYLCFEAVSIRRFFQDLPRLAAGGLLFLAVALIPSLLYQSGNAFLGAVTLSQSKSLLGLLMSPWSALSLIVYSEPVLVALFVGGLAVVFQTHRRIGIFITTVFLLYVSTFYILFRFDPRFVLPLVPFFALVGGYGITQLWYRRFAVAICVLLCIPLIAALRLSYLAAIGDTREKAREWTLQHLGSEDRVLVFSSGMHIPTTASAVAELRSADPAALRKVDQAEEIVNRQDVPHALNNVTSLVGTPFMDDLVAYAKDHGYRYLILEPRSLETAGATTTEAFTKLTKDAPIVAHFKGFGIGISIWESSFRDPLIELFADKILGPDVVIYRLPE